MSKSFASSSSSQGIQTSFHKSHKALLITGDIKKSPIKSHDSNHCSTNPE
jgi:hypothetical protein